MPNKHGSKDAKYFDRAADQIARETKAERQRIAAKVIASRNLAQHRLQTE